MLIRCAHQTDIEKILGWMRAQGDCRYGVGPQVRFPASVASRAIDIAFCAGNAYDLEDPKALRAFG